MGLQLVGIGLGADYVQILGALRRPSQVPHRERGVVPVSKYVPVCKCRVFGASDKVFFVCVIVCRELIMIVLTRPWMIGGMLCLIIVEV